QTCLMRAKAIATANTAYAENNAGDLPYLVAEAGWPVALLPFLDVPEALQDGKVAGEEHLKTLTVPKFICPDDPRVGEQEGLLSYAMNGGFGLFPVDEETGAVQEI